jgi:hypothetical protein
VAFCGREVIVGAVEAATVRRAEPLVTEPTELLTTTSNVAPESATVVHGVT